MAYPRTIRGFNAFIDGIGYFGRCEQATLPKLELMTEEHRGAGMDMPIAVDMGMTAMTAEIAFAEWAPELVKHFGFKRRLVLRPGALGEDSFEADQFIFTVGGRWSAVEADQLKQGDRSLLKLTTSVDYFRGERNGEELFEIDAENGIRRIGGTDQLESLRRAMGI